LSCSIYSEAIRPLSVVQFVSKVTGQLFEQDKSARPAVVVPGRTVSKEAENMNFQTSYRASQENRKEASPIL